MGTVASSRPRAFVTKTCRIRHKSVMTRPNPGEMADEIARDARARRVFACRVRGQRAAPAETGERGVAAPPSSVRLGAAEACCDASRGAADIRRCINLGKVYWEIAGRQARAAWRRALATKRPRGRNDGRKTSTAQLARERSRAPRAGRRSDRGAALRLEAPGSSSPLSGILLLFTAAVWIPAFAGMTN